MSYVNKTSNLFPSANVVYVDNDYKSLKAKGLLAYNTLGDAISSYASGDAFRKYGFPSSGNFGNILLGAGILEVGTNTNGNGYDSQTVDFLNIVGLGKGVSILTTAISSSTNMLRIGGSLVNFYDLTIRATNNSLTCLSLNNLTGYQGNWFNISTDGNTSQGIVAFNTPMNGEIFGCDFDFTKVAFTNTFQFFGGIGSGKVMNCNFIGNSQNNFLMQIAGNNPVALIQGCTFIGDVANELLFISAGGSTYCRVEDCYFSTTTAKGIVSSASTFRGTIRDCTIIAGDNCVDIQGTSLSSMFDCYLLCNGTNKHALNLLTSSNGIIVHGCRLIGNGTGLAINSADIINAEISHCQLRKPTAGAAGSSISSNITNIITSPFNGETPTDNA